MTQAVEELGGLARAGRWQRRVGGLPRPFWYLWTGTLLNRLGSFVGPFLALYLTRSRGFSTVEAGLVLTCFGLGSALSQGLGGSLADRVGRRTTMVGGLIAASATLLLVALAHPLWLLCPAVLVYGTCLDLFRPASQAAVADLVSDVDRPRAYGLLFWAVNLGFSVSSPVAGLVADHSYTWLFVGDALTTLGFAALVFRGVPETRPERAAGSSPGSFAEVLRDRLMLALVGSVLLQALVYMQAFSTLPLVFSDDGLGPSRYGLCIGVNGILIVVLQPFLLDARGRFSPGVVLLTANVVLGVGFGLTAFADDTRTHLLAIVVWTVGEVLGTGLLGAMVASIAPPHLRGRYMGVFGMSFGLAAFVGPLLGTQVLAHLGESVLWGGCTAFCLAAGVGMLLVARAAAKRVA